MWGVKHQKVDFVFVHEPWLLGSDTKGAKPSCGNLSPYPTSQQVLLNR